MLLTVLCLPGKKQMSLEFPWDGSNVTISTTYFAYVASPRADVSCHRYGHVYASPVIHCHLLCHAQHFLLNVCVLLQALDIVKGN